VGETLSQKPLRALELGAGTGLVGLSFAALQGDSATVKVEGVADAEGTSAGGDPML
jgi:tRNA1(Val) A37 N6-methylase TrmN6